jgi:hypothetical protein
MDARRWSLLLAVAASSAMGGCSLVFSGDEHQANLDGDGAVAGDSGGVDGSGFDGGPDFDGGPMDDAGGDGGGDAGPPPPGRIVVRTGQSGVAVRFHDEEGVFLEERTTDSAGDAFHDYAEGTLGNITVIYFPANVTSLLDVPAGTVADLRTTIPMRVGTTTISRDDFTGATQYAVSNGCNTFDLAKSAIILTESNCVSADGDVEMVLLARDNVFRLLAFNPVRVASPPPATVAFPAAGYRTPTDFTLNLTGGGAFEDYFPGVVAFYGKASLWGQAVMSVTNGAGQADAPFTIPEVGDRMRFIVERNGTGAPLITATPVQLTAGRYVVEPIPWAITDFDLSSLPETITTPVVAAATASTSFSATLDGDYAKTTLSYDGGGTWTIWAPGTRRVIAPPTPLTGTFLESASPTLTYLSIEILERSDFASYAEILASPDREGVGAVGTEVSSTRLAAN